MVMSFACDNDVGRKEREESEVKDPHFAHVFRAEDLKPWPWAAADDLSLFFTLLLCLSY